MALTGKQSSFVREYLVDKNATQAAIRAGYSKKTAGAIGDENLKKPAIRAAVDDGLKALAEKTETEAEWIRRRLRDEATDFSEFASHSARIRALELLGKINGIFEVDNKQKTDPLAALFSAIGGDVFGVSSSEKLIEHDDDE
jgi:phage terminase small subunit